MFNRLLKITSGNGEQRWINLDRVTRVSMATDSTGDLVLAFCFDGVDQVKIHGSDDQSRALIRRVVQSLDSGAELAGRAQAA